MRWSSRNGPFREKTDLEVRSFRLSFRLELIERVQLEANQVMLRTLAGHGGGRRKGEKKEKKRFDSSEEIPATSDPAADATDGG